MTRQIETENVPQRTDMVSEEQMFFYANSVETTNYVAPSLVTLGMSALSRVVSPAILYKPYDTREDFDWFTSGRVETNSFRGQHIAIWKKQIVGSGETPLEAERIAKARHGYDCRPAIVYIPKDEEVDTIF